MWIIQDKIFGDETESVIYFEHGKLCQDLRIESILEIINADRKEKDKLDGKRVGKLLKTLKLSTGRIKTHGSNRDTSALIFEWAQLQNLFISFSLSPFPENTAPQTPQHDKPINNNSLFGAQTNKVKNHCAPNKLNHSNGYDVGAFGAQTNQETGANAENNGKLPVEEVL